MVFLWSVFLSFYWVATYRSIVELRSSRIPANCHVTHSYSEDELGQIVFLCYAVSIDEAVRSLPYYTTTLQISGSNQTNLTIQFKRYLASLTYLALYDGQLQHIEANCFSELNHLEILSLGGNRLSYLEEGSLSGMPSLQTLLLDHNNFVSFDHFIKALFRLGSLTSLDLSYNIGLKNLSLQSEAIAGGNIAVEKLDLTGCGLSSAGLNFFHFVNARELRISSNPIDYSCLKNISSGLQNSTVRVLIAQNLSHPSVFEQPVEPLCSSQVELLDIRNNDLSSFASFRFFDSLKKLNMANNRIQELDLRNLLELPNLEHLNLSRNRIIRIVTQRFRQKTHGLKELDLSNNRGIDLALFRDVFQLLPALADLSLSGIPFGKISATSFAKAKNLKKLHLAMCSIRQIEDGSFQSMGLLAYLDLQGNQLSYIRSEMFIGLHNLTTLYLASNTLNFFNDSSPFLHLAGLEFLVLSNNDITHLSPSFFVNLTKLQSLVLNSNSIVPWNKSVVPQSGSLLYLFIQSNKLEIVTQAMISDFSKLSILELSNNDFDCWDCSMLEFQRWVLSTNVTLGDANWSGGKYECKFPRDLMGVPITKALLDTDHCITSSESHFLLAILLSCLCIVLIGIGVASFVLRWHFRYCYYTLRLRVKKYKEVQDTFPYEYDAFVSFDSDDSEWMISHFLPAMETDAMQLRFCLRDRDCVAGNDIMEEILQYIQRCRKIILVLSEAYINNHWCMFELEYAQHSSLEQKRDSLILIQLKPVDRKLVSPNLEYLMTTKTYLIWTEHPTGKKLFWKRLRSALIESTSFEMPRVV